MDIFNSKARQLRCIRNDENGMMNNSNNHHLLEIGKIYNMVDIIVHSWDTEIYLEEFPNIPFNSVVFEEVE